ncbi:MAG TPA: M1 family peptidase, partial [Nitrospira sp.]|nr:M1 family peptidase [Nitrospira sp.]
MNQEQSQVFADPYRLPRHAVPTRYDLRLEPDLVSATFQGRTTIALTVLESTTVIVLNALELTVESAAAEDEQGRRLSASIGMDESLQRCRLTFSQSMAAGEWRLHVVFRGTLNDTLRGFYRSTYKDQTGTTQTMAATQFEATDARRAFP